MAESDSKSHDSLPDDNDSDERRGSDLEKKHPEDQTILTNESSPRTTSPSGKASTSGVTTRPEDQTVQISADDTLNKTSKNDDELETSSRLLRSKSRQVTTEAEKWEVPNQAPIAGVVQPCTDPPVGKPTRHTNCLDFVLFSVIKDLVNHKESWPFHHPVNAVKLGIPEYHNVISRPMDLHTIEKRIRNKYYWSAQEAIQDIKQVFTNCYTFNPSSADVYKMAQTLENRVDSMMKAIPSNEEEQEFDGGLCSKTFLEELPKEEMNQSSSGGSESPEPSCSEPPTKMQKGNQSHNVSATPLLTTESTEGNPQTCTASSEPHTSASFQVPTSVEIKRKRGRPRKIVPANAMLPNSQVPQNDPIHTPHVSIHGRTIADRKKLMKELVELSNEFVYHIIRLIQFRQYHANEDVQTQTTLCDEEFDFNEAKDDFVIEILDYFQLIKTDLASAEQQRVDLETKANLYGFGAFDDKEGIIPRDKITPRQV